MDRLVKSRLNNLSLYLRSLGLHQKGSRTSDSKYFYLGEEDNICIRLSDHIQSDFDGLSVTVSPISKDIIVMIDKRFEVFKTILDVKKFLKSFILIYKFWALKRLRLKVPFSSDVDNPDLSVLPFNVSNLSENQINDLNSKWKTLNNTYNGYRSQQGIK